MDLSIAIGPFSSRSPTDLNAVATKNLARSADCACVRRPGAIHRASVALLIALSTLAFLAPGAAAQYGGISGLFVTTSPDRPGFADFSGLGCVGGSEVVLYFPGLAPTSTDPTASQSVPGRILAVTTATTSADPLLNGTFTFPNVRLPDVEPGVYEIHARCGGLDLRVLIQIDGNGLITLNPDQSIPIENETGGGFTNGVPNGSLPFTGRDSDRVLSLGAGIVAMGVAFLAASRRQQSMRPRQQA